MADTLDLSPIELAQTYAEYFIKDVTLDIMRHLGGSHPIDPDVLESFVDRKLQATIGTTPLVLANTNTISRFLYECADYVISKGWQDPESLETWVRISVLPSIHHAEINTLIYTLADIYRRTVDQTIMGVIAKDAQIAAKSIVQSAQNRVAVTQTGGVLHFFNWGILGDGLWLNGAMLRAFDLASIFRAGDPVVSYYTRIAFDVAARKAITPVYENDVIAHAHGELNMLVEHVEGEDSLGDVSFTDLSELLFSPTALQHEVSRWQLGLTDPEWMIRAITELSSIARRIEGFTAAIRQVDNDLVSELVRDRLQAVNDVVTLVLMGFQALRDMKFSDSLILNVRADGEDPSVDVIINEDLYRSFTLAGGSDSDLVYFGAYLDPRKGISTPSAGWSLSYVLGRRDELVPEMMANEADRVEKLRNNDAVVIQSETMRIVERLVQSYCDAKETNLVPIVTQRINTLARQTTDPQSNIDLAHEISKILVSVIDDPLVTSLSHRVFNNLTSVVPETVSNAAGLAIADMAVDDLVTELGATGGELVP